MFAVLQLSQFALQAVLRHRPDEWTRPVALIDPSRTTPVVCDATAPAFASGVTTGLTPVQAMARCGSVTILHRSPSAERSATQVLLQCAYGFSPFIEETAPGVCTIDLRGLSRLRDGEPAALLTWAGELRTALASQNLRASVGIGATPGLARQAARWGGGIELVSDARTFLDGLPVEALEPSSDVASILHKWGIHRVGELLALGQDALADRLGLEALALFAAASPDRIRPLKLVRPVEDYFETCEFEDPVETTQPLLFVLRRFVDQLSARLELAGLVAGLVALKLQLESGEAVERRLRVPQPTRNADILHRMLGTHLENLRTEAAIIGLSLSLETSPPTEKQFGLFEAAIRDPHQFQETLARLSALVGPERVGTPIRENSHRPDAFRLTPPDFENAPAVSQRRPPMQAPALRRFRPAVSAAVETAPEEGEQRPVSIRCEVAGGRIKLTIGPWRASGRWWEPGAWQREEWDAQLHDGKVVRLVNEPGGWSVTGVLD